MDPATIALIFAVANNALDLVKSLKLQHGMTPDQIMAHGDALGIENKAFLKHILDSLPD